jgi:hypothetical protein
VPRGVRHRTRAAERTVMLMVETADIVPTGDWAGPFEIFSVWRHSGAGEQRELPCRLEELDRIPVKILDLNLSTTRADLHLIPELQPASSETAAELFSVEFISNPPIGPCGSMAVESKLFASDSKLAIAATSTSPLRFNRALRLWCARVADTLNC